MDHHVYEFQLPLEEIPSFIPLVFPVSANCLLQILLDFRVRHFSKALGMGIVWHIYCFFIPKLFVILANNLLHKWAPSSLTIALGVPNLGKMFSSNFFINVRASFVVEQWLKPIMKNNQLQEYIYIYTFPLDGGNGPIKSIPRTSNNSTSFMLFSDIPFWLERFYVRWLGRNLYRTMIAPYKLIINIWYMKPNYRTTVAPYKLIIYGLRVWFFY